MIQKKTPDPTTAESSVPLQSAINTGVTAPTEACKQSSRDDPEANRSVSQRTEPVNQALAPTNAELSAPNTAQTHAADKKFHTLRSAFAQRGHCLHGMKASGASTAYWAEHWGLVHYLPSLHGAALFLAQIGGRL